LRNLTEVLSPLQKETLRNLTEVLSPLPVRERMKVRVLIQRAILRAIRDSAYAPNASAEVMQRSQKGKAAVGEEADSPSPEGRGGRG